ncbi:GNAT family N-acetyltransferase [Paenibacillus sp. strain BS8-2]
MITQLDHRNLSTAQEIIGVQIPAYLVEAAIIGFDGIPALQDTAELVSASSEDFVGCWEEDRLVGVISYETRDEEIDICRLVVHPDFFRRGIAARLLGHLLSHAAFGKRTVVSTGRDNAPAIALYKRFGFSERGDFEVAPGFFITQLVREA